MEILLLCLLVCLCIYLFFVGFTTKKKLITKAKSLPENNHRVVRDYRDHKLQPQPVHFYNNEYMIIELMVYAKQCYLNRIIKIRDQ